MKNYKHLKNIQGIYPIITFLLSISSYAQVGINTGIPNATLEVKSAPSDLTKKDGVIAPRLTGEQLKAKDDAYEVDQTGAIVYITEELTEGNTTTKTAEVTSKGYFYFDGNAWIKLLSGQEENIYNIDGIFTDERTADLNGHNLNFSGNGNVGIGGIDPLAKLNVNGFIQFGPDDSDYGIGKVYDDASGQKFGLTQTTYFPSSGGGHSPGTRIYTSGSTTTPGHISFGKYNSASSYTEWGRFNHTTGNFGLGTTNPVRTLDVEGTMRLSQSVSTNTPNTLNYNSKPLYIGKSNGFVTYAPNGFTTVSGGYRPGDNYVIATFPTSNALIRVSFVCYVDNGTSTQNSEQEAYVYGSFTIIGLGTSSPIKFVDVDIRDYQGNSKTLTTNTTTNLTWSTGTLGTASVTLNQSNGQLKFYDSSNLHSCFFQIMGGI